MKNLTPEQRKALAEKLKARAEEMRPTVGEPIAVIGMSCRFPGGVVDSESYWNMLAKGTDAITEVPSGRWNIESLYNEDPSVAGTMYSKWGGFVDSVDLFDNEFFGVSPREAVAVDPQQRMILEVAWEALEDACVPTDKLNDSLTGVYLGVLYPDYAELLRNAADRDVLETYITTGVTFNSIAGRLSYSLGLQGPCMAVDTACSASLVTTHLACQALRNKECHLALAGGVNLILSPEATILMSRMRALSPDGRCKTFDSSANGYVRGEGCGVLVLKRLSDAVAANDRILAVVRGSAVNQDGASGGLTVPNELAQKKLLRQAISVAGIQPSDVALIEAHGTGTPLGDPIEYRALTSVLKEGRKTPLILGSVKTNLGHLESAAGVAGMMKVILSMNHGKVPAHLHFKRANANINLEDIPAKIPTELSEWPLVEGRRVGGISGFSLSGTNAHVILEGPDLYRQEKNGEGDERPYHLICISAKTPEALNDLAKRYLDKVSNQQDQKLSDIAYSANIGRTHFYERLSFVAKDTVQLAEKIKSYLAGENQQGVVRARVAHAKGVPKVAFLFTGQGSQYPAMAKMLYASQPEFRDALGECEEALKPLLKEPLTKVLFDSTFENVLMNSKVYTQACLCSIEYAMAQLWKSWGVEPSFLMGHSMGEYVAAAIAEIISIADALKLIVRRLELVETLAHPGEMGAVSATEEEVLAVIRDKNAQISVGALNGPSNTVVSGSKEAVEEVLLKFSEMGRKTKLLAIGWASHSPLLEPILEQYHEVAKTVVYSQKAKYKLVSNLTGKKLEPGQIDATYWKNHFRQSVRFVDGMKTLFAEGCKLFVEMAPGSVLLGMGQMSQPEGLEGVGWFPSLRKERVDWDQILESAGGLHANGVAVNLASLDKGFRKPNKISLPKYPFQKKKFWYVPGRGKTQAGQRSNPLVGNYIQYSATGVQIFELEINTDVAPYLLDHQVYGQCILPGSGMVEMAVASFRTLHQGNQFSIQSLHVSQPIIVSKDSRRVQIVFEPSSAGTNSFKIYSSDVSSSDWALHCEGAIQKIEVPGTSIDLEELRSRCSESISKEDLYRAYSDKGVEYGEAFQKVKTIFSGEACGLAEIESQADEKNSKFFLSPTHYDACFQIAGLSFIFDKSDETFLFVGCDELLVLGDTSKVEWAHVEFEPFEPSGHKITANFNLMDATGNVLVQLKGFSFLRAAREVLQQFKKQPEGAVDIGAYSPVWREEELKGGGDFGRGLPWLIIGEPPSWGNRLSEELKSKGADVVWLVNSDTKLKPKKEGPSIDWSSNDLAGVEEQLTLNYKNGFERILIFSEKFSLNSTVDKVDELVVRDYFKILKIVQMVVRNEKLKKTPVYVCSEVELVSSIAVSSVYFGLGRSMALEHPDVPFVYLEVYKGQEESKLVSTVVAEVANKRPVETAVMLRDQRRYVKRLSKAQPAKQGNALKHIAEASSAYLVTGGTGALGILYARWLAEKGAKNIWLLGRSDGSQDVKEIVRKLNEAGANVQIRKVDVGSYLQVNSLLKDVRTKGYKIRGIIHSAGVGDAALILKETVEGVSAVFRSKILGATWLHEASKEDDLDFFVMFSSAAAWMPESGQSSYASANSYLDSLAQFRSANGLKALSINWGPWSHAGAAARLGDNYLSKMAESGVGSLQPEVATPVFEKVLQSHASNVGIIKVDWKNYLSNHPESFVSFFSEFRDRSLAVEEKNSPAQTSIGRQILAASEGERKDIIVDLLRSQVAQILGYGSDTNLDIKKGLMELGMDSLMTVELRNRLKKILGSSLNKTLPPTLIFSYPTIEALSGFLIESLVVPDQSQGASKVAHKRIPNVSRGHTDGIAVVGMSCTYPSSDGLDDYWNTIVKGIDAVGTVPPERWNADQFYDEDPDSAGKTYTKAGGFIANVDRFDAEFFGISPNEALAMDPQHRFFLQNCWRALEYAGVLPETLAGSNTGVFVGISSSDYLNLILRSQNRGDFEAHIPTGTALNAAAGRVAYLLGLQGPTMAVDTACSSSLVAIHMACESIRAGSCTAALVGGVNMVLTPNGHIQLSRTRGLSKEGKCKTFDDSADGFIRSEGCGVVFVKRMQDAIRDGNRILAVIKGSVVNQDGRSTSLTAPNGKSQEMLLAEGLRQAGLKPADISYFETHGTGTPLGDPIEVQAIANVLKDGRPKERPLFLGSVKTNIGHSESASGVAGLIKTILCMQHETIPPVVHFKKLNRNMNIEEIPAVVPTELIPWKRAAGSPRYAGISSFGFSGTNAHVIIGEGPEATKIDGVLSEEPFLLTLSAKSERSLQDYITQYRTFLTSTNSTVSNICFTSNLGRTHFENRVAVVGSTLDELRHELGKISLGDEKSRTTKASSKKEKVSFLFSGQGSQHVGMGRSVYRRYPVFKESFDELVKIAQVELNEDLAEIIFGDSAKLNETLFTQPALFCFEYSLYQLWLSFGIKPSGVFGHSLGEYVAGAIAGIMTPSEGLTLVCRRAKLMAENCGRGAMAAIAAPTPDVAEVAKRYGISVAASNGPLNTVISGVSSKVSEVVDDFKKKGIKAKILNVSHGFHSQLMEPMLEKYEAVLSEFKFREPNLPIFSNLLGREARPGEMTNSQYWISQIREPVKFGDCIETMAKQGISHFLELGPGAALTSMGPYCLGEARSYWYPSAKSGETHCNQMLETAGRLYVNGFELQFKNVQALDTSPQLVLVPSYPFSGNRYWVENSIRDADQTNPQTNKGFIKDETGFLDKVLEISGADRNSRLNSHVSDLVKKALGLPETYTISIEQDLTQIGLDSLMNLRIVSMLTKSFDGKIQVKKSLAFEHATVEAIAQYLNDQIVTFAGDNKSSKNQVRPLARMIRIHSPSQAKERLICFHYAGASANIFKRWTKTAGQELEILAYQLPGRWERYSESPLLNLDQVLGDVERALSIDDLPYAFFGYSMGGLVAFELARKLRDEFRAMPRAILLASAWPVHQRISDRSLVHRLSDSELVKHLKNIHPDLPADFGSNSDLQDLVLPTLRADYQIIETYQYRSGPPLNCPIFVLAGEDDKLVSPQAQSLWRELTVGHFEIAAFKGGHYFMLDRMDEVLDFAKSRLKNLRGSKLKAV